MVGAVGIEPTTPAVSRQCSPAELRAHLVPLNRAILAMALCIRHLEAGAHYDVNVVQEAETAVFCRFLSSNKRQQAPSVRSVFTGAGSLAQAHATLSRPAPTSLNRVSFRNGCPETVHGAWEWMPR